MSRQIIKHFFTFNPLIINDKRKLDSKSKPSKLAKDKLAKDFILAKRFISTLILIIAIATQVSLTSAAYSKVIRLDKVDIADKHFPYLYQWSDSAIKPKAIVIAIHGITMHGLTYERLAYHFAQEGALVFSPDLPGCGRRWQKDSMSYAKAEKELVEIIQSVKEAHKNLPIICLGESLGANLALSTAETNPQLVDGIIISSPALKRRVNVTPKIVVGGVNMLVGLVKTDTIVDLSPYMKAYASEDPIIIQTMLDDPLIHRQIKSQELWDGCNAMKSVFRQARLISKTTPVLIIQGSQDRILKADAIIKLVSSLNSEDQTVKWLKNSGHMILEECEPKATVLQTIDDWFNAHIDRLVAQARATRISPDTANLPPLSQTTLYTNDTKGNSDSKLVLSPISQ